MSIEIVLEEIHSIELSEELHTKAVAKFKEDRNVKLYCGDSGSLLPEVLKRFDEPCVFWLDAHHSGGLTAQTEIDTPIEQERRTVFAYPHPYMVIIDDARLFVGKDHYPTSDNSVFFHGLLHGFETLF